MLTSRFGDWNKKFDTFKRFIILLKDNCDVVEYDDDQSCEENGNDVRNDDHTLEVSKFCTGYTQIENKNKHKLS